MVSERSNEFVRRHRRARRFIVFVLSFEWIRSARFLRLMNRAIDTPGLRSPSEMTKLKAEMNRQRDAARHENSKDEWIPPYSS